MALGSFIYRDSSAAYGISGSTGRSNVGGAFSAVAAGRYVAVDNGTVCKVRVAAIAGAVLDDGHAPNT